MYQYTRTYGSYPRRQVRRLGACGPPGIATQVGEQAGVAAATIAVATIPVVGPFVAPFVSLVGRLFQPSKHSQCAHGQPTAAAYLQCAGKKPLDNYVVVWDDKQCGWYKWPFCCGARGNLVPPGGCGVCDPKKVGKDGCYPGSVTSGTSLVCNPAAQQAAIAGKPAGVSTGASSTASVLETPTIGGLPLWVLLAGGGAALLVATL